MFIALVFVVMFRAHVQLRILTRSLISRQVTCVSSRLLHAPEGTHRIKRGTHPASVKILVRNEPTSTDGSNVVHTFGSHVLAMAIAVLPSVFQSELNFDLKFLAHQA